VTSQIKVQGHTVAKVVGATSSEDFSSLLWTDPFFFALHSSDSEPEVLKSKHIET